MELAKLVKKPALIKVVIDKEEIIKEHSNGEPIEFWTYDRMSLSEFMTMAGSENTVEQQMQERMISMVLNEDGTRIFEEDSALPLDLLAALMNKVMETMGK